MGSRQGSSSTVPPYLHQGPDAAVLLEGSLTEEAVELLHEFVHPHRRGHAEDERRKRSMTSEATLAVAEHESADFSAARDDEAPDPDGDDNDGNDAVDKDLEDWDDLKARPWYRRPSPLWCALSS